MDIETETQSITKVSWEWILPPKLLMTERVLREMIKLFFLTYLCQIYLGRLLLLYDQDILPS